MQPNDLKKLIESQLPNAIATVASEDNVHFQVEVICPDFKDRSRLQQQQMINHIVGDYIKRGEIHALSLKTRVQ